MLMTTAEEWQSAVGRTWAQSWRMTDRAFTGITEKLLDLIANLPGEEALDVGCGAGELAFAVARQRSLARVTGIDVSSDLIAAARERAPPRARVDFRVADAATYRPERPPDLLVSRHGVMFFDDPVGALGHLREVAAPGARLAFSCFRGAAENPFATEPAAAVGAPMEPASGYAPGPFAFGDPDFVRDTLSAAGWAGIRCEAHDVAFVVGQGEHAGADAREFLSRIGPAAKALKALQGEVREQAIEQLDKLIATRDSGCLVAFPAAIWLVTARN